MRRLIIYLAAPFIATACATPAHIPPGAKYASPIGQFSCGPFKLDTQVQPAFGPHGGTVRFIDEIGMTRIDVEEFQPTLDTGALEQHPETVYLAYLAVQNLPLIKSAVPGARFLDSRPGAINEHTVFQSAILMPGESDVISGDGKRLDAVRGQVHYTNGRYMFTISVNSVAWPGKSSKEQVDAAYSNAASAFKECTFPWK